MNEETDHTATPPVPRAAPAPRWQLWELLAFLGLILPSTIIAAPMYRHLGLGFSLVAWSTLVRDAALVALLAYLLWRNGEPLSRIGWHFSWIEVLLGLLLYPVVALGLGLLVALLRAIGLGAVSPAALPFLHPRGPAELALGVALVVVVAVSEETVFRGYLLLRLRNLGSGAPVAVLLSALLFALGHGYQGLLGMIGVGALGAAFALIYLWRGSLVAPMVLHFLQDFLGLLLFPRLGG